MILNEIVQSVKIGTTTIVTRTESHVVRINLLLCHDATYRTLGNHDYSLAYNLGAFHGIDADQPTMGMTREQWERWESSKVTNGYRLIRLRFLQDVDID